MTNKPQSSLLPTYEKTGDIALKNQKTLRKLVGVLGILLPLLVYLFLQVTDNFNSVLPSISHYYFTRAASLFEIIVSLLAVFLMIYKGEKFIDYILSTIAGLSALLMLIFPTDNLRGYQDGKFDEVAVTFFTQSNFRPTFHYICAASFLLCLAFMALFLFTKTNPSKTPTKRKRIRNWVYIACGVNMLLALATAFLGKFIFPEYYDTHNFTFWMEVVALESFGVAWMIKGEAVLADK